MDFLAMYMLSYSLWSSFFCSWKDQSNAFRKEPGLELRSVPTLLKVGQVIMYFSLWPDSFCIESKICVFAMHMSKFSKYVVMFNTLIWWNCRNKDLKKDNAPQTILFRCYFLMNKLCAIWTMSDISSPYVIYILLSLWILKCTTVAILHGINE